MISLNKLYFNKSIFISLLAGITLSLFSCQTEDEPDDNDNNDQNNDVIIEALSDGNFENWTTQVEGEVSFEVPESGWWTSLNMLATVGSPLTMTKSEDAHSGNYAVQLETVAWGDQLTIPGIIASGYFDTNQPIAENLMLGRPYSGTPTMLTGYYKYFSAEQDTLVIYTSLTKFNTETNQRDTIAEANFTSDQTVDTYTKFELFYDYYITDQQPDTINVLFLTSISGQEFLGHVGSRMLIDDIEIVSAND